MFSASWNAPMFVVPSPKNATATWSVPRIWADHAAPFAMHEVRADDGVGAHHPLRRVGEVHRAALAAQDAVLPAQQLGHAPRRGPCRAPASARAPGTWRTCSRPACIAAPNPVAIASMPERQVRRALHQVLQEQVVRALAHCRSSCSERYICSRTSCRSARRSSESSTAWATGGAEGVVGSADQYSLATINSSQGNRVMTLQPSAVTTSSSSIRAADRPSAAGRRSRGRRACPPGSPQASPGSSAG